MRDDAPTSLIVTVNSTICDFCDACNAVCPTNAIKVNETSWELDMPACIGCKLCTYICPVHALSMKSSKV